MSSKPETRSGIFLEGQHGRLLWEGQKELIVKPKAYDKYNAVPIYWFDEKYVYGLLVLGNPQGPISREDAMKLSERTRVSEEEFNNLWPKENEFWVWKPKIYKKFKQPIEHPNWGESSTFKRQVVLDGDSNFPYVMFVEGEEEEEDENTSLELCPFSQEPKCPQIVENSKREDEKETKEIKKTIYQRILEKVT